jgi:hypothetical protein
MRVAIASEQIALPGDDGHAVEVIRHDFEQWIQRWNAADADVEQFWNAYVEPYVRSRLASGSLRSIVGHQILPEVCIGNSRVSVPLSAGKRTYPIEARVDEVDLTAGVAYERTILPLTEAVQYKDVQLAVVALILESLPQGGIPDAWSTLRAVRRFVLESPDGSVELTPDQNQFEAIHEAAALVRDLAGSHLAEWPIRQLSQCSPAQPHEVCSHPFVRCFYKVPTFPQSRAPLRRETRQLCRAQLYELLWQRDLAKYRLYSRAEAGDRFPAIDVEFLALDEDDHGPFVEARLSQDGIPAYTKSDLIVGTPFVGVRRNNVSIRAGAQADTVKLYCDLRGVPLPANGALWPPIDEGMLLEGNFDFLVRNLQKDLFAHQKIGTSDLQRQQQDSALQILDAVFGAAPALETS